MKITDSYDIVRNTFIGKDKGEKHSELEVEIGDIHSDAFEPQFKIKRWDNECNFSIRLLDDELDHPSVETKGNKIKFIKIKTEAHFYNVPKKGAMPECFEFEVILKEKPKTNKIKMSIETKGLKFYYQPELTQEEIGDGCYRPENVVESYAVYHESKQGDYSKIGLKNYRAGKAFHIYRPGIIDSAGKEVWGKLKITDDILTVEIPQRFLDNAVYPVVVDPTFGYTEALTESAGTPNYIQGSFFTGAAGTGVSISLRTKQHLSATPAMKCALYTKTSLHNGSLLTNGGTVEWNMTAAFDDWHTFNFNTAPTLTAVEYYIVAWWNANAYRYFDTVADLGGYHSETYGSWPATITLTDSDRRYSIYCTYATDGVTIPVFIHHMRQQGIL